MSYRKGGHGLQLAHGAPVVEWPDGNRTDEEWVLISEGMRAFAGRRVLLLQGPVGPFFARLTADLRSVGATVHKVNFNAGDWFFYRTNAVNYRGTMQEWPEWLATFLRELDIEVVLLFGDCRPIHQCAREVAAREGVEVGVFEEGYVRPDYVTLERFGVNGFSRLPRTPKSYGKPPKAMPAYPVGDTYWAMAGYAALYFFAAWLGQWLFPHYQHHRPVAAAALWPWVRSAWRKRWYRWTERGMQARLAGELKDRYFLAPLQVFDDAQVEVHANFQGVEGFIQSTMDSFARHAPPDAALVFKHHPMDRGHRNYQRLIDHLSQLNGITGRVLYLHDPHLPTLLRNARGVVVINSTTGMSALYHGRPTFVCGTALCDMPGLTYQGELDEFWACAPNQQPDSALYKRYRQHLIAATQINGSFYKRLPQAISMTGLVWMPRRHAARTLVPPLRPAGAKPQAQPAEA